ncbi:MAG TPA: hypothetical protein VMF69_18760 [Gemmataceae bacterium]|nr:hypothetical protein [Gemmataceae bacterium]
MQDGLARRDAKVVALCEHLLALEAVEQVPPPEYAAEAKPLHEERKRIQHGGRRGPQLLADILPMVLARLGVSAVQSELREGDLT